LLRLFFNDHLGLGFDYHSRMFGSGRVLWLILPWIVVALIMRACLHVILLCLHKGRLLWWMMTT